MKINSPYTAAIMGGGFLLNETLALFPLLQSADREEILKVERLNNQIDDDGIFPLMATDSSFTDNACLRTGQRKKLDTLNKQLDECYEYHNCLAIVAEQAIPLDLDEGVVVNYAKLGNVVSKLK